MAPALDIVIVNWNSGAALADCLGSIAAAQGGRFVLAQVVVVDNASEDDSLDCCGESRLPLRVLRNQENLGFARACNQGARCGAADYVLFLNPDVRLSPGALAEPIAFLGRPEAGAVGICGIRLTDAEGRDSSSCARLPRPGNLLYGAFGLDQCFPKLFTPRFLSSDELGESASAEQIMGAFFLVRRPVYDSLRGFDERFFMYYEEVDFSARARAHGFSSYYLSNVTAVHIGGGCSQSVPGRRLFYSLESRLAYAMKHFSRHGFFCVLFASLAVEPLARIARACVHASFREMSHTVEAYSALCGSLLRGRLAAGSRSGRERFAVSRN
jgi:N-acetylglucosaminyl-diphospho-decaprenol L-rhamnosyltransferase